MTRSDIVIIGGGVIGSSIAFHLAESGHRSILVLERDPSYARASSALSASSIRQQFTTPVCMSMSRHGFEFLRRVGDRLEVDGDRPEIGLIERGYLYLAPSGRTAGLEAALRLQTENDVPVIGLPPASLAARFPWLNVDDLGLGALGVSGEGWFDGYSLMQAFRKKARSLGVTFLKESAVGLIRESGRIVAVRTAQSGNIPADLFVNAAGPQAAAVAAWADLYLPVAPEKRTIFAFRCPDPPPDMPLVVDASGFYVRPEGDGFIAGGPPWRSDADPEDLEPDYAQFDEFVWPALAHRIPAFERIRMTRAWSGHYEMNTFDHNAMIGWAPGTDNFMIAAGFSGHGMQHSPAAGRGVCELITQGAFSSIDLSPLSVERVGRGARIEELNVI